MSDSLDPPVDELDAKLIVQARAMAWKHWHRAPEVLEFDDLLSLAYKGLAEARDRWPRYCQERGFDPSRTRFYVTYCSRRMNGSILDYMRSQDWVNRTVRGRARELSAAGQDQGLSEEAMSASTGMSRDEVSSTLAALARRPVGFDLVEHDVTESADTESLVVASDLMDVAVSVLERQPAQVQLAVVLTFYCGMKLQEVAGVMGVTSSDVAGFQQQGVLEVHRALAAAAGDQERSAEEEGRNGK